MAGLRWGDYVGSPGYTDPVLAWRETHEPGSVASLVALPTHNAPVFALGPNKALLIMYRKEVGACVAWERERGVTFVSTRDTCVISGEASESATWGGQEINFGIGCVWVDLEG